MNCIYICIIFNAVCWQHQLNNIQNITTNHGTNAVPVPAYNQHDKHVISGNNSIATKRGFTCTMVRYIITIIIIARSKYIIIINRDPFV